MSNFTFITSNITTYTLKSSVLIFSLLIFYLIKKRIDSKFKYVFYFIISFTIISYFTKLIEFDLEIVIINLRYIITFASCFIIYFVFNKIKISKNNIFLFVILINLISLIFIYFINYDAYLRPIKDNYISGHRNPQNLFIYFAFFINSIILYKYESFSLKKLVLFLIQILICFYILKFSNIYTKLSLLISLFFFFLLFICKKEIVIQIAKISLFTLLILICVIFVLSKIGIFQETIYLIYYNFLKNLAFLKDIPVKDVCWEVTLKNHDLDLLYSLHKKFPLYCWQFDGSYFNHLWELWLSFILRAYYFTETFNSFENLNDIFFGIKNPNIIFTNIIFPHNSFLDLLMKFGIFVLFLSIFFIFKIFKNFTNENNFFASIFLLTVLFSMNLDDYLFGHRFEFTIIIWSTIGLLNNDRFKNLKL